MTEQVENVLRKSLDEVDRKHKLIRVLMFAYMGVGGLFAYKMAMVQDLRMQMMFGFLAVMLWISALAFVVLSYSRRNTRAILKAIETLDLPNSK